MGIVRWIALAAGIAALSTGCADPELTAQVKELASKVETLEAKVEENAKKMAEAPTRKNAKSKTRREPTPEELEARKMFTEAQKAIQALDYDTAKAKLDEIEKKHGKTPIMRNVLRTRAELGIVGTQVSDLPVEKWYTDNKTTLADGEATLLVFFESWCGYCKREIPKMAKKYPGWKEAGLNVIGLTKVSRSASDESVAEFITQHEVSFPVAKEQEGKPSETYGVRGVPAAAVVKDGEVIWRGHPGTLSEEMIKRFVGA